MKVENLPLVSICIPTYNGASFLEETLYSAMHQTYKNIEIIITDDSSSDDTIALCQKFAKTDSRIKVFENEKNLGLVGNWCESVEKASSKWVKFLFQDDLLELDCVEKMIHAALEHKVDFVICNRQYIFEEGFDPKIKGHYTDKLPKPELIFKNNEVTTPEETAKAIAPFLFNNCIGEPPTFLFNKENYSPKDYPDNYFQLIDYLFILNKILVHNFVFLSDKLVKFRVHNSSESMRNSQVNHEDQEAFYKYLYIQYYERIQICYEVLHNPIFKNVKQYISEEELLLIKNYYVLKSYRRQGFKKVFPFYEQSELSEFILDARTSKYNYIAYRLFKIEFKKVRKKYRI
jgi:glycosyltransferase involved in cell wall biosynthesis